MRTIHRLALSFVLGAAAAACGHDATGADRATPSPTAALASCAPGTGLLTVSPIAIADIGGWVPLGAMNPPAHTFPTDHQYVYLSTFSTPAAQHPVDLVAPANAIVTRVKRTAYSTDGHTDYAITFGVCREVAGEFGHVATLVPSLLAKLGSIDQQCQSYSPNPGLTVSTCYSAAVAVAVSAGEPLGTVGGGPNVNSLDVTLWDTRVPAIGYANPARWILAGDGFDQFHIVAASDYFAEPARSQVASKVGSFDGRTRRTVMPLGGSLAFDVPGTAQGAWLVAGQPTHPETPHLAIAPDEVTPATIVISLGTSQPGQSAGAYRFVATHAGVVNRHPAEVAMDGQVYCDELQFGGVMLLQLVDASTLRVESRPSATSCASQAPFGFAVGRAVEYRR